MGFFDRLLGRDKRALIAEPGMLVVRSREIAQAMNRPAQPNFSTDEMSPCKCGEPLAEVLITTGGPLGDPEVWRDYPIAVDGWGCAKCGVLRYPRRMSPEQIHELTEAGAAHGRAGRYIDAELSFARIVWDWPGYLLGHLNYAEATSSRLHDAPPDLPDDARRRLIRRMIENYEAAVEAYEEKPVPGAAAHIGRACRTLAGQAIRDKAFDRARRYMDKLLALSGSSDEDRAAAEEMSTYLEQRLDLFEEATKVLAPRLQYSDSAGRPPETPQERKEVADAIEKLEEHLRHAPDRWQSAWFYAKSLFVVGKVDAGFEAWRRAYERFGGELNIGRDYSRQLLEADRVEEARAVARALVERQPGDATLWCNLAVCELLSGDLDTAERCLARSRELDPMDPIAIALRERIAGYREGRRAPRTLRELERGG